MGIARPFVAAAAAALAAVCALGAGGCAHAPRAPTDGGSAAAPKSGVGDAVLDWRPLLPASFGTLLKDMPLALHEVLLFHDEAHASAESDNKDCYAADRAPPAFLGALPRVYLFCFTHDHLTRIEAIVDLPTTTAADTLARACALWRKRAPSTPSNPPDAPDACDGGDVGVRYSAKLSVDADGVLTAASFTAFSPSDAAASDVLPAAGGGPPTDRAPITPPHP